MTVGTPMDVSASSAGTSVKQEPQVAPSPSPAPDPAVAAPAAAAAAAPAAAPAAADAASAGAVWSPPAELRLLALVYRELHAPSNALPSPGTRLPLPALLDWQRLATLLQQQPQQPQAPASTCNADACLAKTQQLIDEARVVAGLPAASPPSLGLAPASVSPAELWALLGAAQRRIAQARLSTLQAEMSAAAAKRASIEAACAGAQAALAAQQAHEASHAAAAQAATEAAHRAAQAQAQAQEAARQQAETGAAAATGVPIAPVPLAASTSRAAGGTSISVALQPMQPVQQQPAVAPAAAPLSRQSSLLSPVAGGPGAGATPAVPAAASDSAAASAQRPSPVLLSPSSSGAVPGVSNWPRSAMHTPLKTSSVMSLSRQSSQQSAAATAAGASVAAASPSPSPSPPPPPMTRVDSTPSVRTPSVAAPPAPSPAPSTPAPSPTPTPTPTPSPPSIFLPPARLQELFQDVLHTLTSREEAEPFLEPVSEEEAAGYYDVIKNPMSFADIRAKLAKGEVREPAALWALLHQIYQNCYTYNDKKTIFFKQGRLLENLTTELFRLHFIMYPGPWQMATGRKGPGGRPAKSLLNQPSTASTPYASPAPSPVPGGAASQSGAPSGDYSAAGDGSAAGRAAPELTKSHSKAGRRGSTSAASAHAAAAAAASTPARKSSVRPDADGDDSMGVLPAEGEMTLASGAGSGANAEGGVSELASEGDRDSVHDDSPLVDASVSTPSRGATGAAARKRAASGTAGASASRKPPAGRKQKEGATPVTGAMPTPSAAAGAPAATGLLGVAANQSSTGAMGSAGAAAAAAAAGGSGGAAPMDVSDSGAAQSSPAQASQPPPAAPTPKKTPK